jgi:hypothetical protein
MNRSRDRGFGPDVRRDALVPDHALASAPEEVIEANKALAIALDSRDGFRAKVQTARAEADAAPAVDHEAKKKAIAAGKEPPAPTAPAREAELAEAQRTLEAAQEVAQERATDLQRTIASVRESWKEAELAALDAVVEQMPAVLSEALEACTRASQHAAVIATLHTYDPGNRGLKTTTFRRLTGAKPPEQALAEVGAIVASLPELVTSGPSAAELQAEREAQRAEVLRRRAEVRARSAA